MSHPIARHPSPKPRPAAVCALGVLIAGLLTGCETDAWMGNPSVTGYWEHTPIEVPILTRIAAIEGPEDKLVEITSPTAADLIPEIDEYRVGPGDQLSIVVWDIPVADQPTPYNVIVDARGTIRIPQLGEIFIAGYTPDQVRDAIVAAMVPLVGEGLASVDIVTPRQDSFTVIGAVPAPGQYFLPEADYRVLDALATAGWFIEATTTEIFIIRQIPLSDAAAGSLTGEAPGAEAPEQPQDPGDGGELLDLIDNLREPGAGGGGSPAVSSDRAASGTIFRSDSNAQPEEATPPIDLIDPAQPQPENAQAQPADPDGGETSWMYLNGRWVQVKRRPAGAPESVLEGAGNFQPGENLDDLVTQRVIRIDVQRLLSGRSTENIVIRPGDVVRIPAAIGGFVYLGGQVARGGSYSVVDGLTLERAIYSAGGLGELAIPERVDFTRELANGRQATIRLNYRAITERTQPDIYLRRNDMINVGTNFWAYPLAVIRSGFRATYGFGFLLDRNFGNDVFGAPPTNRQF